MLPSYQPSAHSAPGQADPRASRGGCGEYNQPARGGESKSAHFPRALLFKAAPIIFAAEVGGRVCPSHPITFLAPSISPLCFSAESCMHVPVGRATHECSLLCFPSPFPGGFPYPLLNYQRPAHLAPTSCVQTAPGTCA